MSDEKLKILVIDDDETIIKVVKNFCKENGGYECVIAPTKESTINIKNKRKLVDVKELQELMKLNNIAVVLEDPVFAKDFSLSIAEEEVEKNETVVITTSFPNADQIIKAVDIGVFTFLSKPINVRKFQSVFDHVIENHRLRAQVS